ncbi:hypothetical protein GDO78_002279 [Eleutherodactylus coqui]|uniref:Uncharacterized protein n=1 Tax=Eleutherodactylus coqui TaxID=57060 RepID=A0A8J6EW50_ELECQ|nr:hypothetical protein GDO78_002279 [Eleutherodactylus coqui]
MLGDVVSHPGLFRTGLKKWVRKQTSYYAHKTVSKVFIQLLGSPLCMLGLVVCPCHMQQKSKNTYTVYTPPAYTYMTARDTGTFLTTHGWNGPSVNSLPCCVFSVIPRAETEHTTTVPA